MSYSFQAVVRRSKLHDTLRRRHDAYFGTWPDAANRRSATGARHAAVMLASALVVDGEDDPVVAVTISGHANPNGVGNSCSVSVNHTTAEDEDEHAARIEAEAAAAGAAAQAALDAELVEQAAEIVEEAAEAEELGEEAAEESAEEADPF